MTNRPRKRFAQHFLESAWVKKLVDAAAIGPDDAVLEIGPGRGAITRPLAEKAKRLLAIEVDRDLAADLEAAHIPNVSVVTSDILDVDLTPVISEWLGAPLGPSNQIRIVGNLPYNISSPILFTLLDLAAKTGGVRDALLMLQKEVADRLVAKPGTGEYGVLTVQTAVHADVTKVLSLPPGAYRPPPKVHSAVVRLAFREPQVEIRDHGVFVRMVRTMFTQRRKTSANALKSFGEQMAVDSATALAAAGIDPKRRPETLQLAELARLSGQFLKPVS
jgi:16S rRNA (adenine1518-N6/adenine1519-N6)-dimethyltransferase